MLKKELAKLIETLGDEDNIDETVSKSELGKALANSGLSLEAFKKKVNDSDFKAFMDSEKDKHHTKALETWKTNNLQKLVDDEYYKKHPEETKDPTAIKLAELQKKLEESERANKIEKVKNTITKSLTDKKLPIGLADYIVSEDETKANEALTAFETIFKDHDTGLKKEFVNGNIYVPGDGGEGGKGDDSSVAFAKKLAAGNKVDESLQAAKENYFK